MRTVLALLALLAGPASAQRAWPQATTTDGGLRIWHFEGTGGRFRVVALVGYGTRMDAESEAGAAHLLQHVLWHGSAKRGAEELDAELREHAGKLTTSLTKETLELAISVPAAQWKLAVRQLGERLTKPRFAPEEIERERRRLDTEITVGHVVDDPVDAILFPGSTLGRSALDHHGVASLSEQRLAQIYATWFRPKNMVVAFAGNVPGDECVGQIGESFSGLGRGPDNEAPEPATPLTGRRQLAVSPNPNAVEYLVTGFHVRERGGDALVALLALRALFERGLEAALDGVSTCEQMVEIRTYSDAWRIQWVVGFSRTGGLRDCESAFEELANRLRAGELSDQELEAAKSSVAPLLEIASDSDLRRVVRWLDLVDDDLVGVPDLKLASLHIKTSTLDACVAGDAFELVYRASPRWPHVLLASLLFLIVVGDGLTGFAGARKLWSRISRLRRARRRPPGASKGTSDTLTLEIREFFDEEDKSKHPRDDD